MTAHQIIFYTLAAFILVTGFLSVAGKKIFRSAIFLLLSLLGIAGIYFWMEVEFIAAVQIAVYVGGIVVIIIFSIFLTEQTGKDDNKSPAIRSIAAVLATIFGIAFAIMVINQYGFSNTNQPFNFSVQRIGNAMLETGQGGFSLPFEAVSILLLAAMIGCIVIAMRSHTIGGAVQEINKDQKK